MKMIIQNKGVFSLAILLLLLFNFASCKKDKTDEVPSIPFKITSYYPNSGNAGTLVTIEGEGFGADLSKYSASVSGKGVEVISATTTALVIRMPEGGVTGALALKFENASFDVGAYTYQDLSVKSVFPANGPAGSQIRIVGEGFSSTTAPATVLINGIPALVVSVTDILIVAEIPKDAGFGPIKVKVNGKEAQGQNFTYQAIASIKPLSGGKNTKVTITGIGFEELAAGNLVDFNGTSATVVESTKEKLVVLAPDGVNTGPLSVNINGQKIDGPVFTVVASPRIEVVTPLSGPKGAEMIISGALFSTVLDENKVSINGIPVVLQSADGNELKLILPGGTGSGLIKVVVNDQAVDGPQFKDQTLGITSVSPDNGLAGTTVTITGSGFSPDASTNKVYFNGLLTTVKTATENTIVLDAPTGLSTGELKIVLAGQEAIAPQDFRRAGMSTLAGGPNSNAIGSYASGIAVDQSGNVYVADRTNKVVKKITPSGTVSTLQANGADVTFNTPFGIVIDKQNNIYVSDRGLDHIRKITPSGQNTIYASGFSPGLMTFDNAGNLYVNVNGSYLGINKVNAAGAYTKVVNQAMATAHTVVDANGTIFYVDAGNNSNNAITRLLSGGTKMDWAGNAEAGYADGIGLRARFNSIKGGLAFYGTNKIIAGDNYNYAIREIDMATAKVSTLLKLKSGFADGAFNVAKIGSMDDMAVDKDGNIYILDAANKAVRKVFLK